MNLSVRQDTEVIAHLVHFYYKGDLLEAVENVLRRIRGAFRVSHFVKDEPGRIVAGSGRSASCDCFRRKTKTLLHLILWH